MWRKYSNIFTLSILILNYSIGNVEAQADRYRNNDGLENIACPMDDDPFDPTHLPFQGDCTKFIKCSYGRAFTLSCPRGLEWSISLNRCESRKIAKCDPHAVVIPSPPQYEADPNDCTKAVQSVNGHTIVIQCPEDLYWDKIKNECTSDNTVCDSK